jgi:hypothetical protein
VGGPDTRWPLGGVKNQKILYSSRSLEQVRIIDQEIRISSWVSGSKKNKEENNL